jgi:ABC-type transport system involved in cytochrome bd biosynthesis fused ATPase/permease subunit
LPPLPQVIGASGLIHDILAWANGDSFEAGENGQLLSGGQKARVGLARALYSQRPILLVRRVDWWNMT